MMLSSILIPFQVTICGLPDPSRHPTGEHVFLEDLIEDFKGVYWNKGDTDRLPSCEAVWTGEDLEILYHEVKKHLPMIVG